MTLCFHSALTSDMPIIPHSDFISHILFELIMESNNHTCKVRDASDNFPQTLTLPMLSFLGHMEGGYLVVSLMREADPMTLPL